MVGWHHRLNGHGFVQIPVVGDDREAWSAAVHEVAKSRTRLTELKAILILPFFNTNDQVTIKFLSFQFVFALEFIFALLIV